MMPVVIVEMWELRSLLGQRGGRDFREGQSPSLTYTPSLLREGGQRDRLLNNLSN